MRKKIIITLLAAAVMSHYTCSEDKNAAYKKEEDGVEFISKEEELFPKEGRGKKFITKKIFSLDTEDNRFTSLGIGKIVNFDVDLERNILISDGKSIWKFDKNGLFMKKIGDAGQGPGEFRYVESLRVIEANRVSFYDPINQKFLLFSQNGAFEKEIKLAGVSTYKGFFLGNGHFLILKRKEMPKLGRRVFYYVLADEQFSIIQELKPRYSIDLLDKSIKINLMEYSISVQVVDDLIYIASNMSDNLEIYVYDFTGNLKRIVKQKVKRRKLTKEYKEELLNKWQNTSFWETVKLKHYFPRFFPPFKSFFVDKELGIFVEKYIESNGSGQCLVDWFNSDGVYIDKLSLVSARLRKIKNGLLYCVKEKESGFSKMDVYKITVSN